MKYLDYLKQKGRVIGFSANAGNPEAKEVIKMFAFYQKRDEPITEHLVEAAVDKWKKIFREPEEGGCWFCFTESDDMLFDSEFDTNVHVSCLKNVLEKEPDNPEAQLMKYLLEEETE